MRKHSRGFTLIELLVVIAIIAVLIALLLASGASSPRGGPAHPVRQQRQANWAGDAQLSRKQPRAPSRREIRPVRDILSLHPCLTWKATTCTTRLISTAARSATHTWLLATRRIRRFPIDGLTPSSAQATRWRITGRTSPRETMPSTMETPGDSSTRHRRIAHRCSVPWCALFVHLCGERLDVGIRGLGHF